MKLRQTSLCCQGSLYVFKRMSDCASACVLQGACDEAKGAVAALGVQTHDACACAYTLQGAYDEAEAGVTVLSRRLQVCVDECVLACVHACVLPQI